MSIWLPTALEKNIKILNKKMEGEESEGVQILCVNGAQAREFGEKLR